VAPAVRVARGASVTLEFRFRVPADVTGLWVLPSARVPPVRWRFGGERWTDREVHNAEW
jgi:hypothetical protein